MKSLEILLFISYLFVFINSTCETDEEDTIKYRKYADCKNRNFDSDEIYNNAYRCCYIKIETETANVDKKVHGCIAISQTQYDNLRTTIREKEAKPGVDDVKIDCESSYLIYGLYSLFLFLL